MNFGTHATPPYRRNSYLFTGNFVKVALFVSHGYSFLDISSRSNDTTPCPHIRDPSTLFYAGQNRTDSLITGASLVFIKHFSASFQKTTQNLICCVKHITKYVQPACSDDRAIVALDCFLKNPKLLCLPVFKKNKLGGLINRHRFMENHMVGKYGFGHSLNYYKTIDSVLEDDFIQVDQYMTIEEVAKLVRTRSHDKLYDDIFVTSDGYYLGIVSVSDVLSAITENNFILAIGANPLSGLPGNDFIQRKIRELLERSADFDICYIDIDFFKPYNDKYGFAMGDEVIKQVADLMVRELERRAGDNTGFAGHIGGDDFILIAAPKESERICRALIAHFAEQLIHFHGQEEYNAGSYRSIDRKGMVEEFPLLSLSIAIVSTVHHRYHTYAELSSVASELKKKAKKSQGSVIVKDQRLRR